ncbi:hypothetical protein, partial [Pseudomonas aeruginosa]
AREGRTGTRGNEKPGRHFDAAYEFARQCHDATAHGQGRVDQSDDNAGEPLHVIGQVRIGEPDIVGQAAVI